MGPGGAALANLARTGSRALANPGRGRGHSRAFDKHVVCFRGKDQQFVADWLVQQGLQKLVDVLKVCFLNFNMYFDLKSHNFKANSEER